MYIEDFRVFKKRDFLIRLGIKKLCMTYHIFAGALRAGKKKKHNTHVTHTHTQHMIHIYITFIITYHILCTEYVIYNTIHV